VFNQRGVRSCQSTFEAKRYDLGIQQAEKSNSPLQEQVERSQCRRIESDDEKIDDEHSAYILLQPL
jgi:hypothetical protein